MVWDFIYKITLPAALRGREWESLDYTKREIFALGCGIYDIVAWKALFPKMAEEQIGKKHANEEFPDTNGLLVRDVIRACWNEKFDTVADVGDSLEG